MGYLARVDFFELVDVLEAFPSSLFFSLAASSWSGGVAVTLTPLLSGRASVDSGPVPFPALAGWRQSVRRAHAPIDAGLAAAGRPAARRHDAANTGRRQP